LTLCLGLLGSASLASAVECKAVKSRDLRYTVCTVDMRKDRLDLVLYDEGGKALNSFQHISEMLAGRNEQLAFAMNAGMYREDFSPLGLMVTGGKLVHRINLASGGYGNFYIKPNGVFIVSGTADNTKARIVESSAYHDSGPPPLLATQSGPLLVKSGQINELLNPQGPSHKIRNGVGITGSNSPNPGQVVFVISDDPVNFYEFAQMFKDELRCDDALYLDGSVSSLYWPGLGRNDDWSQLGPVFVVTRQSP
jgi:uncharacterized protein YigE (DUF2233 family)